MMVSKVSNFPIISAAELRVIDGVAIGDALSLACDLVLDDVYQLRHDTDAPIACFDILQPDAHLIFMAPNGTTMKAFLFETEEGVFFQPLGEMQRNTPYRLICCEQQINMGPIMPEAVLPSRSMNHKITSA